MALWIRLRITGFANPSRPVCVARKISAIPPSATRLTILYRPWAAIELTNLPLRRHIVRDDHRLNG